MQHPAPKLTVCIGILLATTAVRGDDPLPQPSVFDLRGLQTGRAVATVRSVQLMAAGRNEEAEKLLAEEVGHIPFDFSARYNLACAQARQGKTDEALVNLKRAVEDGFRDPKHLQEDADLESLRKDARFAGILETAGEKRSAPADAWKYDPKPAKAADGQAVVDEGNTAYMAQTGLFRPLFELDAAELASKPICVGFGPAGDMLRKWQAEGTAAGNAGDLYDNHDNDHVNMNCDYFPQLTRVEYADAVTKRNLHHGLQVNFLFDRNVVGNSSTALTQGAAWRSQGRAAFTMHPPAPAVLYLQYRSNHLYVYPEHRDYDAPDSGDKGVGDTYPLSHPYFILSQGSSGSDVVFCNAVAATLAAFQPATKQKLMKTGMLMPTVQMIFRSSNRRVQKPEDYLTGIAHPAVFQGGECDAAKMVEAAHAINEDNLPPWAELQVVEENLGVPGVDYFDYAAREVLCTTPCAVARIVKSTAYQRRMVVSAERSQDPEGKPLKYEWRTLQGDPEKVHLKKLNESGSKVEITVDYHDRPWPVESGSSLQTRRVDIGLFVNDGQYYSAPVFVSFCYLPNQKRTYDDKQRILTVDYTDEAYAEYYIDPLIEAKRDWRDDYHYDESGKLTGWTRTRKTGPEQFTAEGKLVLEQDGSGKPTKTAGVVYLPKAATNGPPLLEQRQIEAAAGAEP